MAEIEKSNGTINITVDTTEFRIDNVVKSMCSQTEGIMTYIGERVTASRTKLVFVSSEGKYYYVSGCFGVLGSHSIELREFMNSIEDTEPISAYKYRLEYCVPGVNPVYGLCMYYKENELKEAEQLQEMLGKDFTYIHEI